MHLSMNYCGPLRFQCLFSLFFLSSYFSTTSQMRGWVAMQNWRRCVPVSLSLCLWSIQSLVWKRLWKRWEQSLIVHRFKSVVVLLSCPLKSEEIYKSRAVILHTKCHGSRQKEIKDRWERECLLQRKVVCLSKEPTLHSAFPLNSQYAMKHWHPQYNLRIKS